MAVRGVGHGGLGYCRSLEGIVILLPMTCIGPGSFAGCLGVVSITTCEYGDPLLG